MNAPDPFESFYSPPGEEKIVMQLDTRMPNTAVFRINREDHTIGNLIARSTWGAPGVECAGRCSTVELCR